MTYRYFSFTLKTIRWRSMRWTEVNSFTPHTSFPWAHNGRNSLVPIQSQAHESWLRVDVDMPHFIPPSVHSANLPGSLTEGLLCIRLCASTEGIQHREASSCQQGLRKHQGLKITQEFQAQLAESLEKVDQNESSCIMNLMSFYHSFNVLLPPNNESH